MELLLAKGATTLLHLGDVGSPEVLDALAVGEAAQVHVVFGNVDLEADGLGRYAQALGILVDHPVGRLAVEERREVVFLHGDDVRALIAAMDSQVAYVCHGHTHRAADVRRGKTRVINPGALYRATPHTVAMLDTVSDQVWFYSVDGQ